MLDWLAREGGIFLSWWLLVALAGAAALPLCMRLLGGLPDRGYTLARSAGLLLVGFVFWLLASLGLLRNTTGDMLLAWLVVLIVSLAVYSRLGPPIDLRVWWRENRTVVVAAEVLFFVLFLGWTIYRAYQNNLTGTEKPMELMFLNAIQRSDTFPPNDAWMSGYAISYYYFGYVIAAMLAMLSGIPATTGFNMTAALLFALTGLATFGVVYNLVRSRAFGEQARDSSPTRTTAMLVGLLGMVFVVLLGNFQLPFVEIPYQTGVASEEYLRFWNMDERQTPIDREPDLSLALNPEPWGHWWWFRASRVLSDRNIDGTLAGIQPIDEFPQFSFLLSDNHPHVLALPFVMLALGMALNILLSRRAPTTAETLFYALAVGGLIFLNTWDGPVYLFALVGAEALRRVMRSAHGLLRGGDWLALVGFGAALLALALVFYFPFLVSFRSQAAGLLPNLLNPTLTQQYFLMFGPFLLLVAPFLAVEAWRARGAMNWRLGFTVAGAVLGVLVLAMLVLILAGALIPSLRAEVERIVIGAGGWEVVMPVLLARRVETLLTTLLLLAAMVIVIARLFPRPTLVAPPHEDGLAAEPSAPRLVFYPPATGFALLLVGVAVVLTLVPEFIYLRDNFGTRINTIFKFYYQAWLAFSVAAAYAVYTIFADARLRLPSAAFRAAYGVVTVAVLTVGLLYPVLGIYSRAFLETGRSFAALPAPLTLDGGSSFIVSDDYQAIMCLNELVDGDNTVVVEAVGPPYRPQYGRVAALTGIPIVMGWENHERQWRGPTFDQVAGTRPSDIPQLYQSSNWDIVQEILVRYNIDYVFFGQTERVDYGAAAEQKFRDRFEIVCEHGSSRFYRVPLALALMSVVPAS